MGLYVVFTLEFEVSAWRCEVTEEEIVKILSFRYVQRVCRLSVGQVKAMLLQF